MARRSARSRGGRPKAGQELKAKDVAAATLEVIAQVGMQGLTRAHVAERLGVSVRSLYRLAPSHAHLVATAVAEWQRRWSLPPDTGEWRADLRRWCIESRAHAGAYPGLTDASQRVPLELMEDHTQRVAKAVVTRLVEAGFQAEQAGAFFGVLSMHCLGWAMVFQRAVEAPVEGSIAASGRVGKQ